MSFTLGELAVKFGCELRGDPAQQINSIATLSSASAGDISFFTNKKYLSELRLTQASAVILKRDALDSCAVDALVCANPYATYARIAQLFHPPQRAPIGVHATAVILASHIPDSVCIGPNVVIEENVQLGENVSIAANSFIGKNVTLGNNCTIAPNVTIQHGSMLGSDCIIHSGVVIGGDGFGQAPDVDGFVKIPQIGNVLIGNSVEIGANTTVDRGTLEDTVIENGVKLDNLIQIGHNVRIGEHTVIAACTGISGSTTIGKRCMIGGRAGFVGHIEICDDVIINSSTVITSSITEKGVYSGAGGFTFAGAKEWMRNVAQFKRLNELAKRIKKLEKDK
ncbi:MAG: UDP-3-O-(3-hydroxymyristoyl)glucosamine N-acyltransferase [Gammaproteobacteria bacterium]|nr:UDP-3-O-(3-hydroxymyristoyl)glucosamine N-acyltransferase [Gammaproteobacteria bacterium]NNC97839.1 UDP-3-O-(3-hydroxymyristoyl)glucosamine N-acyltransferase [Gammaproteobacteria bacterium]NNM13712.1 UDP-3-O-(3-hydroxymyristoyl)glucosamine N-acyltransferase [Gammaproteobacteria bacterium]